MTRIHRTARAGSARRVAIPTAPEGMGDLLPPEAAVRRALAAGVLGTFARSGYELVTPPVFEHAEVLARGTDGLEARDLLRFVEPESGEVAVLRPDITPQIARIVATRLADRPAPIRLCYEGRVFRRTQGRARNHRQISQAGVECVGLPGADGDAEIIALAASACEDAGLRDFRIEMTEVTLVRSVLAAFAPELRARVSHALAHKDRTTLDAVLPKRGASARAGKLVHALLDHCGEPSLLSSARRTFKGKAARAAIDNIAEVTKRLEGLGLGERLVLDLGEPRGLSYYTGVRFAVLAAGPGEEVGGGGRYDDLLGRYGAPMAATGFALDLGHLQWTLTASGRDAADPDGGLRVVITGTDGAAADAFARKLRDTGIVAATVPKSGVKDALAFAQSWGYHGAVVLTRGSARVVRSVDGSATSVAKPEPRRLAKLLGQPVRRNRS